MGNPRIIRIERGELEGVRPRKAGCNARLGEHGLTVRVPLVRLLTDDGVSGFGFSRVTREQVEPLLGALVDEVFSLQRGVDAAWKVVEYPLWDLAGKLMRLPVYVMAAAVAGRAVATPLRVPCYDTSLYFDDLHLADTTAAAALIADEARAGYERGHLAFKIKIGRGARHLPLEEGMRRDIAVVRAVRSAVGAAATIMVDANNGFNLNLTKRFLAETAECRLYWIEEPFHEDGVLYRDLKEWMREHSLSVLIADGEGDASPRLMDWARDGLIDVVQRDIISWGFTQLLALAKQLDEWRCLNAPHHYGTFYGNYAECHLAAASDSFAFVEWDEASVAGLDAPGYVIQDGRVTVPHEPGFGLELDDAAFRNAVESNGYCLTLIS